MHSRLRQFATSRDAGFSLVELLLVVAIIGVLVALLLPAIQSSRETARISHCANNLKQMALGFLNHESAHGYFPTGGWGFKWIGEPDEGYGKDQPGGWAYNILAYIEQEDLRNLGSGIADRFVDPMNQQRQKALMQLVSTPVSLFTCPSKRPVDTWPYANDPANPNMAQNVSTCTYANGCRVVRGDYRVNSGNRSVGGQTGPGLVQNPATYPWVSAYPNYHNGICHQRSMIRVGQVTDGAARTAMLGEKYLNVDRYFDGEDSSDDQCIYVGHDQDNAAVTGGGDPLPPLRDQPRLSSRFRFGSAHAAGLNMAFCDGSVVYLAYDIDEPVWRKFGGRNDETPL
jgi:prepilin-type N-terminal cleavage/methylation domain-containing protein/prepilin-type processing-associated H-X9-DG protein